MEVEEHTGTAGCGDAQTGRGIPQFQQHQVVFSLNVGDIIVEIKQTRWRRLYIYFFLFADSAIVVIVGGSTPLHGGGTITATAFATANGSIGGQGNGNLATQAGHCGGHG